MKNYYPTIGLEIHAEMSTRSKMFCGCKNDPNEERPNVNICPVCMAHPGTLPVINKQAVENVIKVGLAVNATIATDFTEFDRKNYFYPDIPKGYQISQYKFPIVSGGELAGVQITRVHLEEDTGNSKHDRGDYSLVDYNRAGVPLMELVTEPVIHSAEQAANFGRELQLLLQYLGVSEANMEKGEMRVEANISLSDNPDKFGTKVEVKNLNSFRSVERAIKYELARMQDLYEAGRQSEIVQETRGWDESKQTTFSQRKKEDSHDYRYFPDPDLPKLVLKEVFDMDALKASLPELPSQIRTRYQKIWSHYFDNKDEAGWDKAEIEKIIDIFVFDIKKSKYLDELIELYGISNVNEDLISAINMVVNVLIPISEQKNNSIDQNYWYGFLSPSKLQIIQNLKKDGQCSAPQMKEIINGCYSDDVDPLEYAKKNDLIQKNDEGALKEIAQRIIDANPAVVATYKSGKENALMSLVGQVMKETKGSANPQLAQKILKELIG
ncbi:MAG: Asp-tRNA(Asn)/Glu-tRNA(Gln) amidotransferase subunit GatB [Candidatus Pacebacteria bacterium]|nr:Asp-tRNA(Asn)/Glu-tRNA(Gln) amidotransferase subunit GatB [Candidatus Paceibacterota bacterium]MBP9780351.1 Asp-tRNA(Asn)/Glu-tRNA(Gln) amidotransferase subunit GatB [Candidatus Paceibacterota bacterium]